MTRKVWLGVAMLATGFTLLVAAGFAAGATTSPKTTHGKTGLPMTLNFSSSDFDYLDPALAYLNISLQFRYLTDCRLLYYPDKPAPEGAVLKPDWANLPTISKGGTVYTFTMSPNGGGCKFTTGEAVTAQSFADAINRDLNPQMSSPAVQFISDIVGADDVVNGKATTASGVVVKNPSTLQITLKKASADFLGRITMPFFAAIPHGLPIEPKGLTTFATAGPYKIDNWTQGRSAQFSLNPNYKGKRPRNVSRFNVTIGTDPSQSFLQVKSGQVDDDLAGPPPTEVAGLRDAGLLNKQLFVNPLASTTFIALNTARPLFGNVKARQAVNYAVDRHALLAQFGVLAGKRDDQFLAPAIAGYEKADIYPTKAPNLAKAKSLFSGGGNAVVYIRNRPYQIQQGSIFQYNLKQIGIDASVQAFAAGVFYTKAGTKGEPYDAMIGGWGWDYPDPFDFLNVFFDGNRIQDANNQDFSYINDPKLNQQLEKAATLTGDARYKAYGDLDIMIAKDYSPHANLYHPTFRDFFAPRMDPSCYVFQPIYGVADLATLCFK
jgi:ABC-type oligopeptide transport system substrate-binding subunit